MSAQRLGKVVTWSRVAAVCATFLMALLVGAPSASAAPLATVKINTQRMSAATLNVRQAGWYYAGSRLSLSCYARGQSVKGYYSPWIPGGWDNLWYRTSDGFWVADVDIDTGSNNPVTGACPARIFNPDWAAQWALMHVYEADRLGSDCTYFASRDWWAAGLPSSSSWTDGATGPMNVWGATFNAAVADGFKNYVVNSGFATINQISGYGDVTAGGAQLGDVIAYDWNSDGFVDHLAIVVGFQSNGTVIVAQHTVGVVRNWNISSTGAALAGRSYLLHEVR